MQLASAQTIIATVPVGNIPTDVAVNDVTNKIYVVNQGDNTVTEIDGSTNSTTTIPVGNIPISLAVNKVINKVYVANALGNTVTVIDGATMATTTIPVGNSPRGLALNPVTNKIYVINYADSTVTVIDGWTNIVTTTIPIGFAILGDDQNPDFFAIDTVRNRIYVRASSTSLSGNSNMITVIDGVTNATNTVTIFGNYPNALGVNEVTNKVYVAAQDGTVTVIDGSTFGTTRVPSLGLISPNNVLIDTTSNRIFVVWSNPFDVGGVTVVDGVNNQETTIMQNAAPWQGAIDPRTKKLYTSYPSYNDAEVDELAMIDMLTDTFTTLRVGVGPTAVAANANTNRVYVVNYNTVSVVAGPTVLLGVSETGNGAVISGDGHIHCGSNCSFNYASTTPVFMTGVPAIGSTFMNWTGCDTTAQNTCFVNVDNPRFVTAAFTSVQVSLSSLTLSPNSVRGGRGSVATLTLATPAPNGGVTVGVSSSKNNLVLVPNAIYIPGGARQTRFLVRTLHPVPRQVVAITATEGSSSVLANLTVGP
jgi:YVTN family beta-propeller protein